MRKNLFKLFFVLVLTLMLTLSITKIKAAELSFTTTEVINQKAITDGINWKKVKAQSVNDEGQAGNQVMNYVEINKDSAQIITWAITNEKGIKPSTLLQVAADFEAKYPNYQVVAGINNDYFGSDASTGVFSMRNVSVIDGVVFREKSSSSNMYGLALDENNNYKLTPRGGQITISEDYYMDIYDPRGTYVLKTVKVDGFNTEVGESQTVVYKGAALNDETGLYKLSVSANSKIENSMYIDGKVAVIDGTELKASEIAIKTNDVDVARLLDYQVKVRIYKTTAGEWADYQTILGCPAQFLKEGVVQTVQQIGDYGTDHVSSRHPRTSIGFKADGTIIFMTIDGRQSDNGMDGVSERENAMAMLEVGALNAFNFDGGGSTTFAVLIDGTLTVTNSPSDGGLRSDATYALAVVPRTNISLELEKTDNGDGTTHVTGHANITPNASLGFEYSKADLYVDGYSTNQSAENFAIDLVNGKEYTFAVALTSKNTAKVMHSEKVMIEGEHTLTSLGDPMVSFNTSSANFMIFINFEGDFTLASRATIDYGKGAMKCIKTYNGFSLTVTNAEQKEYNLNITYRYYDNGEVKEGLIENYKYQHGTAKPTDFVATLIEQEDGKYQLTLDFNDNGLVVKDIVIELSDDVPYEEGMLIDSLTFGIKLTYNAGGSDIDLHVASSSIYHDVHEYVEPKPIEPKIDPEPEKETSGCAFGALSAGVMACFMSMGLMTVIIKKRH